MNTVLNLNSVVSATIRLLLAAGFIAWACLAQAQHPGAFDPSFQGRLDSEVDAIHVMVKQPDGKIIVGGSFDGINGVPRQGLARLNVDGSLDAAFDAGLNGGVEAAALQADGKIVVGGSFSLAGGVPRQALARLQADGTLDLSFAPSLPAFAWVSAVAAQPDGKVLAAVEGMTQDHTLTHLLRFLPDGGLDVGFPVEVGDASDGSVQAIVLQPDGKILVAGSFQSINGLLRRGIARLNGDGSVDLSFDPGTGTSGIADLRLQPDGRIVIGGAFDTVNEVPGHGLARLMPDGSLDTSFVANTECCLSALALQPDGKLLIGGGFRTINGVTRNGLARLLADGSVDLTFDPGSGISPIDDSSVLAMLVQEDGNIVIGGTGFLTYDGFPCVGLARLYGDSALVGPTITQAPISQTNLVGSTVTFTVTASGTPPLRYQWQRDGADLSGETNSSLTLARVQVSGAGRYRVIISNAAGSVTSSEATLTVLSAAWAASFNGEVRVLVQAGGKILAGGAFSALNGLPQNGIARLNDDGSADLSFNPGTGANGAVNTLAQYNAGPYAGKIVVAGEFTSYNGIARFGIARLNADGTLDMSFNSGAGMDGAVASVALQPDGKVLLGGSFSSVDLRSRPSVARLNADGSLDTSFNAGNGVAGGSVQTLALLPDGKVLIGGDFTSVQGQARSRIAQLNADGTLDTSFDPGSAVNGVVNDLIVQSNGKVVLVGGFSRGVTRLNVNGTLDLVFNPGVGANGTAQTVLLQPDGKLVMGGAFSSVNGVSRQDVARLNTDGSLDLTLDPGTGTQGGRVNALALQGDGAVVVGGLFSVFHGRASGNIAKVGSGSPPTLPPVISQQPANQSAVVGGTVTFSVTATGTLPLAYQWQRDGANLSGQKNATLTLASARLPDAGAYRVVVSNTAGSMTSAEAMLTVMPVSSGTVSLIPMGAVWKYLATGVDQGTAWIAPSFNDSAWPSGPAQLGYGDGDEATTVSFGPDPDNKYITTYFRRSFVVNAASALTNLNLRLLVDDGAVVYLNGVEVFRANLPMGATTYSTLAVSSVENAISSATLSPALLVNGTNVVAVEVHQNSANSTDLSFDCELGGGASPEPPTTPPTITGQPTSQTVVEGGTATFTVAATGTPPLSYQWQKDGANLNGKTNASVTLGNVQPADAGHYCVIVSNVAGSVTSAEATLTVIAFPTGPGSLDLSFDPGLGPDGSVAALVAQPDGKVLIGGQFTSVDGHPRFGLARLNTDGSLDPSFNPGTGLVGVLWSMALQPDGKILIGGAFTNVNGVARNSIARLNADGSVDLSFASGFGADSLVTGLLVQPFRGMLVAGWISIPLVLEPGYRVVRLLSDGQLDPTFNTNAVAQQQNLSVTDPETGVTYLLTDNIAALALQSDGKILVGGGFSDFAGMPRSTIARLNQDGSLDLSFNPGLGAQYHGVRAMALQADGHCLVGGTFTRFNGVNRLGIARLLPDGSLDATFDPRLGSVEVIVVDPDQKILAGGPFPRGITRLNPDGTADPTFDVGTGAEGEDAHLTALLLQEDGRIVIGGTDVDTFNSYPFMGIARLNGNSPTAGCRLITSLCPRTGQPQVMLTGPAGARVVIEATSDLKTWTPLMTVTNTLGSVQVCDPTDSGSPQRFYRARLVE